MFTIKELEIVKDLVEQEIDELEAIASDEDVEEALDELEIIVEKIEKKLEDLKRI
ncbi:MAG: hypothetical protein QM208_06455 [Bacillota bacterium]|jgi:hypothetical protein|nr:hypothetical protein [Bacillota bacterium]